MTLHNPPQGVRLASLQISGKVWQNSCRLGGKLRSRGPATTPAQCGNRTRPPGVKYSWPRLRSRHPSVRPPLAPEVGPEPVTAVADAGTFRVNSSARHAGSLLPPSIPTRAAWHPRWHRPRFAAAAAAAAAAAGEAGPDAQVPRRPARAMTYALPAAVVSASAARRGGGEGAGLRRRGRAPRNTRSGGSSELACTTVRQTRPGCPQGDGAGGDRYFRQRGIGPARGRASAGGGGWGARTPIGATTAWAADRDAAAAGAADDNGDGAGSAGGGRPLTYHVGRGGWAGPIRASPPPTREANCGTGAGD
eukprot:scaffold674_cov371-Prasinococcus_capsulatus_cf.AAC.13